MTDPIHTAVARWHQHIEVPTTAGLRDLLHPDVVFVSPIVFTPQRGRDLTMAYLTAAAGTLAGPEQSFTYTKEVLAGTHAVLEFETEIDGKYVNGVDIITCDADSLVTEFRVMIRPLQAIDLVHAQMRAALEQHAAAADS